MELQIGDHTYVTSKLKSKQQRNIAKRLVPILLSAKDLITLFMQGGESEAENDAILSAAGPVADAFGRMSDADSDYIFDTCFEVVKRQTGSGWQSITTPGGILRYEDIDLPAQLRLVVAVIQESIGDFSSALPGNSSGAATKA